ncbi:MAG: hypothetical protein QXP38_00085 [Nitrososphaerota archaeon]
MSSAALLEKAEERIYRHLLGGEVAYSPEYSAAIRRSLEEEARHAKIRRPRHVARLLRLGEGVTIFDLIMLAHRYDLGYTWFCIGQRGSGKTTLAALLLYAVYGSWDSAKEHLVYDLEELDAIKERYSAGEKAPLVVFDDAALHLNNRRSWDPDIREFVRSYATIREYMNTVIFVAHDIEAVDSALRRDINGILFPTNVMDILPVPSYMFGGRRVALFSLIKTVPDLRDPLRSFRYRIPIHDLNSPIYFHELPPDVKAIFIAKKKASTDRVDISRTEMSVKNPEVVKLLDAEMWRHHKALLKILQQLENDGKSKPKPIEILQYIRGLDHNCEEAAALRGVTENMLIRYLKDLTATVKPMILGDPVNGYFITRQGHAFLEFLKRQEEEREEGN